jgi:hypothetical protein
MDFDNGEAVRFDHVYNGTRHRCGYLVAGDKLIVVVEEKQRIAALDRMTPERLAHILVRELLIEADFANERKQRAIEPPAR